MNTINASATLHKAAVEWCAEFRHPLASRRNARRSDHLRRSLGTANQAEAEAMLDQLNEILARPDLWERAPGDPALDRFDPRVIASFYGVDSAEARDSWDLRDEFIPLPGGPDSSDGYSRVLLVGTTGAGKTTVVRQLLGTDPERERFPSISAAKTTICDMELVLAAGPFRAVGTFLPRQRVCDYISECVLAAVIARLEGARDRQVVRKFLEHSEQRFRLRYILGNPDSLKATAPEDVEEEDPDGVPDDGPGELTDQEREQLLRTLLGYLSSIDDLAALADARRQAIGSELGVDLENMAADEQAALQDLLESELVGAAEFEYLVVAVLDDVESRFGLLAEGDLVFGPDGWPIRWTYQSDDRSQFIRTVNRFSSNYGPLFGRLLTPLVDGIRVAGPFSPSWYEGGIPRLVLMDGEGIGHVADGTTSLSTSITRRFRMADTIVLADNAAQPMQAGSCKVLETLVTSGYEPKLIVAFTHFDEVKGDNLWGVEARKDHVIASFDNATYAIDRSQGGDAGAGLRRLVPDRLVFLAHCQRDASRLPESTRMEFRRLLDALESAITQLAPSDYQPVYDVAGLIISVEKAAQEFHERWGGVLGTNPMSETQHEHWTRIKALTRRLGTMGIDEYHTLRPVADLKSLLMAQISRFLSRPSAWFPYAPPDEGVEATESVSAIKRDVHERIDELARRRVMEWHIREWAAAYEHRGIGSTRIRANDVVGIYRFASPVVDDVSDALWEEFLSDVRSCVAECVLAAGGRLKGWGVEEPLSGLRPA